MFKHLPQAARTPSDKVNILACSVIGKSSLSPYIRFTPEPLRKMVTSSPSFSMKLPSRRTFHLISGSELEKNDKHLHLQYLGDV